MFEDLAFRGALLLLLVCDFTASVRLRRAADRAGGRVSRAADSAGVALALRLGGAVYYGTLLLWLLHPPFVRWAGMPLGHNLRWFGAVLGGVGVAFALWSLSRLGRNVTPTAVARSDADLVVSGPYRWVRHPLYSSMGLTIPGFALLSANLLVLGAGAATFAVIAIRTRREEIELVERFGSAYADYMERTGRFFPRIG